MNQIILSGIVQGDAEFRKTDKYKIAKYSLMVMRTSPAKDGSRYCFFDCTAFDDQADFAEAYIKKGKMLTISGECLIEKYVKDGIRHKKVEVIVNRQEFTFPKTIEAKLLKDVLEGKNGE